MSADLPGAELSGSAELPALGAVEVEGRTVHRTEALLHFVFIVGHDGSFGGGYAATRERVAVSSSQ